MCASRGILSLAADLDRQHNRHLRWQWLRRIDPVSVAIWAAAIAIAVTTWFYSARFFWARFAPTFWGWVR